MRSTSSITTLAAAGTLVAVLAVVAGPAAAEEHAGEMGRVIDARTEVELIAEQATVRPGESITLGLRMAPDADWHTYWKNPGGSGEGPTLTWQFPEGFEAGEPQFPTPERHPYEVIGTNNYGYSSEIVLPITAEAPAELDADEVRFVLEARWLTCDPHQCIPGKASLALALPVRDAPPAPGRWARLFEQTRERMPTTPEDGAVVLAVNGDRPVLHFRPPEPAGVDEAYFFPEPRNLFDYGAVQSLRETGDGHALELPLTGSAGADDLPDRLRGVLTFSQGEARYAWQLDHAPGEMPAAAAEVAAPRRGDEADFRATLWAIGLALLGGMLLNLMPCVFPILSLKVLGLLQTQGASRRESALHGISYGAGVMLSFWILAFVLIGLRGAGEQLRWGFHLQSPGFIAVMTLLVFAIGLNLAGVFEIGSGLVNLAGKAEQKIGGDQTARGAFGTGVLATALATPCTAPLMGPAVGFALSQPPAVILAVLTALGLGMALPYVLLYLIPAVGRALPRPGAWMATFKQALSFPMFAVAVWLVWVFGNQVEYPSATLILLSALLVAALALWIVGRFASPERSTRARWLSRSVAVALLALSVAAPLWVAAGSRAAQALPWEPYDEREVAGLREEGRMVFVNFTADWCVNCQVLEQTVLASGRVTSAFAEHDTALLKADWTNHDEDIAESLARFDRRSVPFFLLYPGDPNADAIVLGEWITRGELERALERAAADSKP